MPSFGDKVTVRARALRATPEALLVVVDGAQHWVPQSQIDDDSEVWKEGDAGKLVISAWIAQRKGIE